MDRAARAPDPRAGQATPRPWRMSPLSPESRSAWVYAGPAHPYGPHTIAAMACADAALICRAVNSHDDLVAALQQCLTAILKVADDESTDPDNALYWHRPQGHGYQMVEAAKAAIRKAQEA